MSDVEDAPSPSFISPGMVKRIREIFEDTNGAEIQIPVHESKSTNFLDNKDLKIQARKDGVFPLRSTLPNASIPSVLKAPERQPSSPRNIRNTTVPTSKLLDLLRHYRNLCVNAGEQEKELCTELLEADEPFIGMILDEPSSLSISGDSLVQVRRRPGNDICADCGADDNSWASTNIGVFICIRCSGVHRSLGVHISTVLSCSLDIWPYELIEYISTRGNTEVNKDYEHHLHQSADNYLALKLKPGATTEERNLFIRSKYVSKEFHCKTIDPNLKAYKLKKLQLARTTVRSLSSSSITTTKELHNKAMVEYSGIVFINLQEGHKICKKNKNSLTNQLYIVFKMGSQTCKSKKWKNLNKPRWNEAIQLNLPMEYEDCELEISAFAHAAIKNTETIVDSTAINVREPRFTAEPQKLELPLGEGILYLTVFVTDLKK